nr:hypothetical protein [Pseudomonas fluorescens]
MADEGKGMLRKTTKSLTECLKRCTRFRKQRKGTLEFSYELSDAAVVAEIDEQLALLTSDGSFDINRRDDFLFFVFLIRRAPALRKSFFSKMNCLEMFTVFSRVNRSNYTRIDCALLLLKDAMSAGDLSKTIGVVCDIRENSFNEWVEFVAKKVNSGRKSNSVSNPNPWLWILDVASNSLWSAPYGKKELQLIEILTY